jgi:acetyl esterase
MMKHLAVFTLMLLAITQQVHAEHAFTEYKNIEWSKPKGFALTADIYVPQTGKKHYPVLIIYHGGGWLINRNVIMDDMSHYIASHSDIAVVNVNYRLLADNNNTTGMNEIVEDALGAVLWVKDNIKHYGGDPNAIAVTGDSAGGHLAAMVMLAGRNLESDGFAGPTQGFNPSYLPKGKTAEQIAKRDGLRVKAAVLSYAALDIYEAAQHGFESPSNVFWGFAKTEARGIFGPDISLEKNPEYYKAVSPMYLVPKRSAYKLPPQFVFVGSKDQVTRATMVSRYVDEVKAAGQPVEFKIYEGKPHGYLDNGCNAYTQGCFKDLATPTLDDMIQFLTNVFK